MKKLMIAVAAAAMIGGAYADYAYDFAASVKTTKAKSGSQTNQKIQLGRDVNGKWWYTDTAEFKGSEFVGAPGKTVLSFDKNGVGKLSVSKLTNDEKALLADAMMPYADIGAGIPEYYKGKIKWCANFSYKLPGQCYRVAGSEKFYTTYEASDCCGGAFTSAIYNDKKEIFLPDLNTALLYHFGAQTADKANKVEYVGYIGDGIATDVSEQFNDVAFALAGQGTWAKLRDSEKDEDYGVKSISGNIVGVWYDPECEVCCGKNGAALVWDCDWTELPIADTLAGDVQELWGTAAYGTFTLKFNAKNSDL